jgi:hypothetical protein
VAAAAAGDGANLGAERLCAFGDEVTNTTGAADGPHQVQPPQPVQQHGAAAAAAAPDVEQPSQPETCGFSAEAFARFMLMALALAARVKDFTYVDADGQTYTGIEALARVERDETLKKLSRQRPEYQRLKRWYIIMGLATVHGFDGAATFFDSCLWTVGKEGDGERHCDATSQFYRRNVMWIVPLLAKSGAVAVCEAYLSAVMDLCVEGEPGTNSHKCVAQNAAAGCSREWNKVPAFRKFSEQTLEISRRGLQLVGEEAKKLGATVCCLSETAAFWPQEQYKKATMCGSHNIPWIVQAPLCPWPNVDIISMVHPEKLGVPEGGGPS